MNGLAVAKATDTTRQSTKMMRWHQNEVVPPPVTTTTLMPWPPSSDSPFPSTPPIPFSPTYIPLSKSKPSSSRPTSTPSLSFGLRSQRPSQTDNTQKQNPVTYPRTRRSRNSSSHAMLTSISLPNWARSTATRSSNASKRAPPPPTKRCRSSRGWGRRASWSATPPLTT